MLGDLQKSGVYHAVYTDLMQQAWTSLVGTPTDSANAASPAADGTSVYAAAGMPGQLVALAASNGTKRWLHPNLDAVHFEPVSVADRLVYETDIYGYLRIVDAATGLLVAIKDLYGDSGGVTGGGINVTSAGVALARNTVYAATSGVIVAYR
jgi:outer membrane protein assembly factor BamB